MATREQLERALRAADAAGNVKDARALARAYKELGPATMPGVQSHVDTVTPQADPAVLDNAMASVGLGDAFAPQPTRGAPPVADLVQPVIETIDGADGKTYVMPGSMPAAIAAQERAQRELAYQEGQQARHEADVALNPVTPGSYLMDLGRTFAGAEAQGVSAAAQGLGGLLQTGYNNLVGVPMSVITGDNQTVTDNPMQGLVDLFGGVGNDIKANRGAGFQQMLADNQIEGDILQPSTISLGKDPSMAGFIANGVDVMGQMAPIIAASLATGGSAATGAIVGGAQGGGAAMQQAEQAIDKMAADGTLAQQSRVYRDQIAAGATPEQALAETKRRASEWAFTMTAPVSAAGGALTGKIVAPVGEGLFPKLPGLLRVPAYAGLGAAEEGSQEVSEGYATQAGTNQGAGTDLALGDGSAANAILGAFGGLGEGTVGGLQSKRHLSTADQLAKLLQQSMTPEAVPHVAATMTRRQTPTILETDGGPARSTDIDPALLERGNAALQRPAVANTQPGTPFAAARPQTQADVTVDGKPQPKIVPAATAPAKPASKLLPAAPVDAEAPSNHQTESAIHELPIAGLSLSTDVPQFKSGADDSGVVEPLGGEFDRRGTGPIQVWRRNDGSMEVISGRHRLDLARRSGEQTIPAQVYNEADGFDVRQAASLDAELNIRDGQGKVKDYVNYFQNAGIDQEAADARGLLARSTGKRAFSIATRGTPELIAAHSADQLTDEAAVQIADAAPNSERLQSLGMKLVQDGKPIGVAANTMRAVQSMGLQSAPASNGDLFGFDDSAIQDAIKMAGVALRQQRELGERIAAIRGASKRPELAKKEGVDVRNPKALDKRVRELTTEKLKWDDWASHPELVSQVRKELGLSEPAQEPPQAAPEAPQQPPAAPSPDGGLFGAPSAREIVQGAARAKDAERNGQTGNGAPSFASTDLGAAGNGAAPAQSEIPDAATQEAGTDSNITPSTEGNAGVEFANGQESLQSRLEQWRNSSPVFDGGRGRLVPQERVESSRVSDVARPEGSFVTEFEKPEVIRAEAEKLIEAAKADGFFWDADAVASIAGELVKSPNQGGSEHDAYIVGEAPNQVVIRNTANGAYGPRRDLSPGQYLQRLDEYNRTFPGLQMRVIGVSQDADGNAVIWTAQPFVFGEEFATEEDLAAAMTAAGWTQDGKFPRYTHKATGAIIEDAHTGNILHRDGELFPIDVHVEKLPAQAGDDAELAAAKKEWAENLGFKVGDRVRRKDGTGEIRTVTGMAGKYLEYQWHADPNHAPGMAKATDWEVVPTKIAHPKSSAPEHVMPEEGITPLSVEQMKQVAADWREYIDGGGDADVTQVFDAPEKADIVRMDDRVKVYHKDHGWMTPAEAKAKVAEWKKHAREQAAKGFRENSQKVVLSLFDKTGAWAKPWEEAGYQVYTFDIQSDPEIGDVNNFSVEHFVENFGMFEGADVYAILAACPCTDFAVSGARHFAEKDVDGRTQLSVQLVKQTLATIEFFKPPVWSLENPVGRIEGLTGLPPWRLAFNPNAFGHDYTKRTQIWGRFNADLPIAPVDPVQGSKMHQQFGGKSQKTKDARSETPEGFAYAFFMANNAIDNPVLAVAGKYELLDRAKIKAALDAGATAEQIDEAVEEFYYQSLDFDGGNNALDYIAKNGFPKDEDFSFWEQFAGTNEQKAKRYPNGGFDKGSSDEDLADEDLDGATDGDDDIDALRRMKKRKAAKPNGPITSTRAAAPLAYEMDVFTDNGFAEDEIANMPPKQQLKVAQKIVQQTFGFKTMTVANDLNTLEAMNHLKFAYSNLQSMAAVMGWPAQTFGKIVPNLELARNAKGGALAYLSPTERKIVITRQNDAFAHEFGHGVDWWVWNTMKLVGEDGAPKGRAATGKLKMGGALVNSNIEEAFGHLLTTMYKADGDAAFKIAAVEKHIEILHKQIHDLQAKLDLAVDDARIKRLTDAIEAKKKHIERLSNQISQIKGKPAAQYRADTNYYLNARMLDKNGATEAADGGYWQRPTEMFARAFEAFVAHQVELAGGATEFLGMTDAGYLQPSVDFIQKAYPQALDRIAIFDAIENLMNVLRDDITDGVAGPVAEIKPADPLPPAAWREWVPRDVKPLSLWHDIKHSMDTARAQRESQKTGDAPRKLARQRLRDSRNSGTGLQRTVDNLVLQAIDTQMDGRAAWAQTITGFFNGMQKRYPGSTTFAKIAPIFTTTPGTGKVRHQTIEEYKQATRNFWGNQLARIVDKHDLNSFTKWSDKEKRLLRDAMVDGRESAKRPEYTPKILRAAEDLRTFHDEMWQLLQNSGIDLGYARNGYLQRIMNPEMISTNQRGFLDKASTVYREVFERDVGVGDDVKLDEFVKYAIELVGATDPDVKRLRNLAAKLATAIGKDGDVAEIHEAIQQLLDGDEGGLYKRVQDLFASAAASDWMGRLLGTTANDDFSVQTAQGSFMKSRTLPESADITLGDFMVTDPMSLSATYMASAINRIAFEKFIPGEGAAAGRIDAIRAALAREGVLPSDQEEAVESIKLVVGLYRPNLTKRGLRVQSSAVALVTPVLLGRSFFSQIMEPFTAAMRTGNVIDGAAIMGDVLADIGTWLPGVNRVLSRNVKNKAAWRREMAEFVGAVTDSQFDHIMNNRENTIWANKKAGQTLAAFYHYSMIHPHTMAMRRAAVQRSTVYFQRIARKALKGNKLAIRDLADLGIDFKADQELVKYLANDMPLSLSVSELRAHKNAQQITNAINRFVDEIIINPKIVDKPRKASTAEMGYIYGILSYQSAFTNNVLLRTLKRLDTIGRTDGMTELAKQSAVASAMVGVFLAGQTAQFLLRYAMFGKDDLDDELKRWKEDPQRGIAVILSRSGMFGMLDPIANALTSAKYRRSFSDLLAGAYYGFLLNNLNRITGAAVLNSDKNNTAEYNATSAAYDLFAATAIAQVVLRFTPWAAPALAWTSAPATRDAVTRALVGEKGAKTGPAASGKTTDSGRQTRHNGHKSGRNGGR